MSEFEELKLTVTLQDNASSGLQRLRAEIGQMTTVTTALAGGLNASTNSLDNFGKTSQEAAPKVRAAKIHLKELERSAAETTHAIINMASLTKAGLTGMPQIALAFWDASRGVSQMAEGLAAISPVASVATLALGGIAVGVLGIGAAVIAYGFSVFKMSKEMDELDKSAKSMGISFVTLKSAQDQAIAAGESAELMTRNFHGIQATQLDLSQRNSELKQKLMGQGVSEDWINKLATAKPREAFNLALKFGDRIEQSLLDQKVAPTIAKAMKEQFGADLGMHFGDLTELSEETPEAAADLEKIKHLSIEVQEIWNPLKVKLEEIAFEALIKGLPLLVKVLGHTDEIIALVKSEINDAVAVFKGIGSIFNKIVHPIDSIDPTYRETHDDAAKVKPHGFGGLNDVGSSDEGKTVPRSWGHNPVWDTFRKSENIEDRRDEWKNSKVRLDETGSLNSQLERLNAFFERQEAKVEGGSGAVGLFGGGGARGGDGGAAVAAAGARPAETGGEAVTAAQAGGDLDKGSFDKTFRGTPLEGKYDKVVESAKNNNVPASLMAGIMAHETGAGTSSMLRNRNNPAGLMDPATNWMSGKKFSNVDEGIDAAGRTIAKNYKRGGGTIAGMANIYAPQGAANDLRGLNKNWQSGVTKYQGQMAASPVAANSNIQEMAQTPTRPGPTIERAAIDRAATTTANKPTINGGLKTEVEAPPGTKVEVEGGGAFKKTETTRSTTMSKETADKLLAVN